MIAQRFEISPESLSGRDIARLRWVWLALLMAAFGSNHFLVGIPPSLAPIAGLLLAGSFANALATRRGSVVLTPLLVDVILLGAILGVAGGAAHSLAILLPAPAFVAALSTSPRGTAAVAATVVMVTGLLALFGGAVGPAALAATCAMAGLAFLAGLRMDAALTARLTAETALEQERAAGTAGIAFAAAAHEIASPLSTIRVAAGDLAAALEDRPEARADALLIGREARRCGAILGATRGSEGSAAAMPLTEIVEIAAEPHRDRGIKLLIEPEGAGSEPLIRPGADAIRAIGNLVQNAVDFARREAIVEVRWTAEMAEVIVSDDGDGFATDILKGVPPEPNRPRTRGGPGTGSGLALARALLARSGGSLELGSAGSKGARVRVTWRRPAEHG